MTFTFKCVCFNLQHFRGPSSRMQYAASGWLIMLNYDPQVVEHAYDGHEKYAQQTNDKVTLTNTK